MDWVFNDEYFNIEHCILNNEHLSIIIIRNSLLAINLLQIVGLNALITKQLVYMDYYTYLAAFNK